MKIDVLGAPYETIIRKYDEDETFSRLNIDGYCNGYTKQIVICDLHTYKGWENEPEETLIKAQKHTLRHEIVHAFLTESGLSDCAVQYGGGWAKNEEMVDWIAMQGQKIYRAWMAADAM